MFLITQMLPKYFLYLYNLFINGFNFKNGVLPDFWAWLWAWLVDRQLCTLFCTLVRSTKWLIECAHGYISTRAHGLVDRYFGELFLFGSLADRSADQSLVRTYCIFWPTTRSADGLQRLVLTSCQLTGRSIDALSPLQ